MINKLTALILALIIIMSVGVSAKTMLKGVDRHWAGGYATELNQKGILSGDDYGNANLNNDIKRSEFIAMLIRALYHGEQIPAGGKSFADVKNGAWYYDIASYAKDKGIVGGDENGNLLPESDVSREEIVLMLVRALKLTGGQAQFSDVKKDYKYYTEISAAVNSGIVNGYGDGTFGPKDSATRGETAAMIVRVLKIIPNPTGQPEGQKINLTWHQIYNTDVAVTGNHMEGLNVISPTWFRVIDNTGKTPYSYEQKLGGDNNLYIQDLGNSNYMKDAKMEGYTVWALLKTDFDAKTTSKLLNDDVARQFLIENVKNLVLKYNLDGINIDFENMYVGDKDKYTQFVKEMSAMTKSLGIKLSVDVTKYDVHGGTWSLCYDRAEIAKYVDYVALMSYDENGTWSEKGGSVASMSWVEEAIKITLKEVPAEKLLMGVPFYTRLWEEKDGKVVKTSAIGMKTAQDKIKQAGAQIVYDVASGQNYAEWSASGKVYKIWLEDEFSMTARVALIEKYKLAGVASWSKTFETANIWTVINRYLNIN